VLAAGFFILKYSFRIKVKGRRWQEGAALDSELVKNFV
jgi:hypothetical protein